MRYTAFFIVFLGIVSAFGADERLDRYTNSVRFQGCVGSIYLTYDDTMEGAGYGGAISWDACKPWNVDGRLCLGGYMEWLHFSRNVDADLVSVLVDATVRFPFKLFFRMGAGFAFLGAAGDDDYSPVFQNGGSFQIRSAFGYELFRIGRFVFPIEAGIFFMGLSPFEKCGIGCKWVRFNIGFIGGLAMAVEF